MLDKMMEGKKGRKMLMEEIHSNKMMKKAMKAKMMQMMNENPEMMEEMMQKMMEKNPGMMKKMKGRMKTKE
jgi:Asp-tRNA(Asn)/Glu-tRNA(Gln) amidotransferase B subunit